MVERLPIIVLTGPSDDLKAYLANSFLENVASSYAVMSETAMSQLIGFTNPLVDQENFAIDGCLCCIGGVTLMAQLTRFLRSQRREQRHQGLLLIGGPQTNSAALIDQLRQPLLAGLIEIKAVVFAAAQLSESHAEAIAASNIVYLAESKSDQDMSFQQASNTWLRNLPGSKRRMIATSTEQLREAALQRRQGGYEAVWMPERTFDRTNLQHLFYQAVQDGLCFDAVFRTQRAWYRWHVISQYRPLALMQETAYRQQSYLDWYPEEKTKLLFRALKERLDQQH